MRGGPFCFIVAGYSGKDRQWWRGLQPGEPGVDAPASIRERSFSSMKIVTAAEMREIDRVTSQRFGVASLMLMENAGTAVAELVVSKYPSAERIGVICGKGNNGGDGFVAARKLHGAGKGVRIILLAEPSELRGDAAEMFGRLPVAPLIVRSNEELQSEQVR